MTYGSATQTAVSKLPENSFDGAWLTVTVMLGQTSSLPAAGQKSVVSQIQDLLKHLSASNRLQLLVSDQPDLSKSVSDMRLELFNEFMN